MSHRFYRIAGSKSLPPVKEPSPQKLTQTIVKDKKYLYIDINEQNGLNLMESINQQQIELDAQKIGKNYICNLKQLSYQTRNTIDYIYKLKELRNIKQKYKDLIRDQITKNKVSKALTQSKILGDRHHQITKTNKNISKQLKPKQNLRKQSKKRSKTLRQNVLIYRGINSQKLQQVVHQRELENTNKIIFQKQKNLISKYGMTNHYQTIANPKLQSPIVRKKGKVFLPQINSASVSQFNIQ